MDKTISTQIKEVISSSNNVLMTLHPNPDGDSVGSNLAMYFYLKSLNKNVTLISGDDRKPAYLSFLPGFDVIEEKNIFDINLHDYDLLLTLDIPSKVRMTSLGDLQLPANLKLIMIDHHQEEEIPAFLKWVDPNSISTCQMIFYLFKSWEVEITPEMAICLFLGLFTDSGGFRYQLVNEKTFLAAAELVKIYPDFYKAIFEMDNNNTEGRLRFEALSLNNIKTFFSGQVAISIVNYQQFKAANLSREDASGVNTPNKLKSVVGWELGISINEKTPGKTSIGFRTRDENTHDVSAIAQKLGGGGHKAAAGALVEGDANSALKLVLEAIQDTYPEFGKP